MRQGIDGERSIKKPVHAKQQRCQRGLGTWLGTVVSDTARLRVWQIGHDDLEAVEFADPGMRLQRVLCTSDKLVGQRLCQAWGQGVKTEKEEACLLGCAWDGNGTTAKR